ncbi:MAG: hypothetical protein KKB70_01820 [Proteobacteria bacterium]|nr:hypothetical protein [Pseudomonadota bacterium]MBU1611394.1 hypothetical protein [Pseudomonadota bacterium]
MFGLPIGAITGLFSGSSITKYLVGGLVLAVLLGWLCWSRASLKADLAVERAARQSLQTALDASEVARKTVGRIMDAQAVALVERRVELENISSQREVLRRRWQEAKWDDQEARAWSDAPLPGAVRELLR